ncbi:hypothetical protein [Dysgonomonas sp. 520]|uniref:hypothetical protein n=1 Tax=Dysgonomonas sp. 520 TaxID=2302931 RepID=UPI0013D2D080|nr:hypothetical protein [Dysgonomonas sp. 520]NDW09321.1 hypothetical protein [Dysgonomonas sp. 520]
MKIRIGIFIIILCSACNTSSKKENNNSMFDLSDWNNVKEVFNQWRKQEIKKGYFVESCLSNAEEFINKYGDKWETDSLRYALPNLSEKFNSDIDTCMVDINLDGKQDVIFKINPIDCVNGNGASAHPPLYISVISSKNSYIIDNTCISKVETAIRDYRKQLSNREYQWFQIDSIRNDKGIIVMSGNSSIYLNDDANCCPSIELSFVGYINKSMKGHINIEAINTNQFDNTESKFKTKLVIK